jgi:hypothetical protein
MRMMDRLASIEAPIDYMKPKIDRLDCTFCRLAHTRLFNNARRSTGGLDSFRGCSGFRCRSVRCRSRFRRYRAGRYSRGGGGDTH